MSTIQRDLDLLGVKCEDAMDLTRVHLDWRSWMARCASTAWGRSGL